MFNRILNQTKIETIGSVLSFTNFILVHYLFEHVILKLAGSAISYAIDVTDRITDNKLTLKDSAINLFSDKCEENSKICLSKFIKYNHFFSENQENNYLNNIKNIIVPITTSNFFLGIFLTGTLYSLSKIPYLKFIFSPLYNLLNLPSHITEASEPLLDKSSKFLVDIPITQKSYIWKISKEIFSKLHDKIEAHFHLSLLLEPIILSGENKNLFHEYQKIYANQTNIKSLKENLFKTKEVYCSNNIIFFEKNTLKELTGENENLSFNQDI